MPIRLSMLVTPIFKCRRSAAGTADAATTAKLWHPAAVTILVILVVFLWLRIWVHYSSPDRPFTAFPDACPPSKQNGCNRVADGSPLNNRHDPLQHKLSWHIDQRQP